MTTEGWKDIPPHPEQRGKFDRLQKKRKQQTRVGRIPAMEKRPTVRLTSGATRWVLR